MLVGTLLQSYEQNKRSLGLSEDTIARVKLNASMFLSDMQIDDVGQISTETIVEWGEAKLTRGISQSTLYTYYNSIRAFLRFVESKGHRLNIDYEYIRCKPRYKERVWLKPHQITRIINCSTPQTAILVRLLYTSGMRISEAINLSAEHLHDTTIVINGKGNKYRPIFVTHELLNELRTLAAVNGGFCFVDNSHIKMTRKKAYYQIKKSMLKAGFGHAHPHSLRHSYCTELLRKGADLSSVSRMMGHSSVSVTEIYTHLLTEDIEKTHLLLTRV